MLNSPAPLSFDTSTASAPCFGFGKFDVPGTMRVWTAGGTISGVTALIVILILSMFTGTLPGLL